MELKPGTQLASTVCDTQVVVVRAPEGEVELTCGGRPMVPVDQLSAAEREQPLDSGEPPQLGKRYEAADIDLEVLCTKAGTGPLAANGKPLEVKQPKAVPASD